MQGPVALLLIALLLSTANLVSRDILHHRLTAGHVISHRMNATLPALCTRYGHANSTNGSMSSRLRLWVCALSLALYPYASTSLPRLTTSYL